MANFDDLYERMDRAAGRATDAAGNFNAVLTADENTDVIVEGQRVPSMSKRIKSRLDETEGGLREDLSDPDKGAALVALLGGGKVSDLAVFVTPEFFGAKGDKTADDTDAVIRAIEDGRTVFWGGSEKVYRVTRKIEHVFTKPMHWVGQGATIFYDPPEETREAIRLTARPDRYVVEGVLNVDANMKAFIGFYLNNPTVGEYPANYADVFLGGLKVQNVYRSSTRFSGGNGIWVLGAWRHILLNGASAKNCVMAKDAQVQYSQGIFGITVSGTSAGQPVNIVAENLDISGIRSEDPAYHDDQDGFTVIVDNTDIDPDLYSVRVDGGTFENCYGRSIKLQAENARVSGSKFIRTEGWARGYGNQEIDFQEGGGVVEGTQHIYKGSAPLEVVQFVASRKPGKSTVPYGRIDGMSVSLSEGTTLSRVWRNTLRNAKKQVVNVSNVEVLGGTLTSVAHLRGGLTASHVTLLMDKIVASPTGAWVSCSTEAPIVSTGVIKASKCVNIGEELIMFKSSSSGNLRPTVSTSDCVGFFDADSASNTTTPSGVLQRVGALASETSFAGIARIHSFRAAPDTIYDFPPPGNSSRAGVVLVSVGQSRDTQGGFSVGTQGARVLFPLTGVAFGAGDTSDPGSGSYRIWYEGGLKFKNATANARDITLLIVG